MLAPLLLLILYSLARSMPIEQANQAVTFEQCTKRCQSDISCISSVFDPKNVGNECALFVQATANANSNGINGQPKNNLQKMIGSRESGESMTIGDMTFHTGDVINLISCFGNYISYRETQTHHMLFAEPSYTKPTHASNITLVILSGNSFYMQCTDTRMPYYYVYGEDQDGMKHCVRGAGCFISTPGKKDHVVIYAQGHGPDSIYLSVHDKESKSRDVFRSYDDALVEALPDARNNKKPRAHMSIIKAGVDYSNERLVDFNFDMSSLERNNKPLALASQHVINNSPVQQSQTIEIDKTYKTTKSFTWDVGISFSNTISFTVGVPTVDSVTDTFTMEVHFDASGTKSDSDTRTFKFQQPIAIPPKSTITAQAIVFLGKIDVPYVATYLRDVKNGFGEATTYAYKLEGTFHNVDSYATSVNITCSGECEGFAQPNATQFVINK